MAENVQTFVKEYRLQHNMTQEEVATKIGVSRQSINAIERGRYTPSLLLALKFARLFHCPVENLFILQEAS